MRLKAYKDTPCLIYGEYLEEINYSIMKLYGIDSDMSHAIFCYIGLCYHKTGQYDLRKSN